MVDQPIAELENRNSALEAEVRRAYPNSSWLFNRIGHATAGDADALRERIRLIELYVETRRIAKAIFAQPPKIESETEKFRRRWAQVQADNNSVFRTAVGRVCDLFNNRGRP